MVFLSSELTVLALLGFLLIIIYYYYYHPYVTLSVHMEEFWNNAPKLTENGLCGTAGPAQPKWGRMKFFDSF